MNALVIFVYLGWTLGASTDSEPVTEDARRYALLCSIGDNLLDQVRNRVGALEQLSTRDFHAKTFLQVPEVAGMFSSLRTRLTEPVNSLIDLQRISSDLIFKLGVWYIGMPAVTPRLRTELGRVRALKSDLESFRLNVEQFLAWGADWGSLRATVAIAARRMMKMVTSFTNFTAGEADIAGIARYERLALDAERGEPITSTRVNQDLEYPLAAIVMMIRARVEQWGQHPALPETSPEYRTASILLDDCSMILEDVRQALIDHDPVYRINSYIRYLTPSISI